MANNHNFRYLRANMDATLCMAVGTIGDTLEYPHMIYCSCVPSFFLLKDKFMSYMMKKMELLVLALAYNSRGSIQPLNSLSPLPSEAMSLHYCLSNYSIHSS